MNYTHNVKKNHMVSTFSTHDIQCVCITYLILLTVARFERYVTVHNKLKFPPPLPSLPFHELFHSQPLAHTDSLKVRCLFPFWTHLFVKFIYIHEIETWKEDILREYACGTCFSGTAKSKLCIDKFNPTYSPVKLIIYTYKNNPLQNF